MVARKKKEKKQTTTIQIEVDLVPILEELGHMHDNYSDVIRRLLPEKYRQPSGTKETGEDE